MNLKGIFTKSFRFLVFDWRFFAIVLVFYVFLYFIGVYVLVGNQDLESLFMNVIPKRILHLLFWVSITPLIIHATREYFEKQQKITFKWGILKRYFVPLFTYQLLFFVLYLFISALIIFKLTSTPVITTVGLFDVILGFILFLVPVIIVLENKTFIGGAKKSIEIIRNKFKECVIFYLILLVVIGLLFDIPTQARLYYRIINGQEIAIPGLEYLQLILNAVWFIFYLVAVTVFYLNISEKREKQI